MWKDSSQDCSSKRCVLAKNKGCVSCTVHTCMCVYIGDFFSYTISGVDTKSTNCDENTGIALLPDLASSLLATSLSAVSNRKVGDRPRNPGMRLCVCILQL